MTNAVRSTTPFVRNAEASDAAALAELMTQLGYPTTSAEMSKRLMSILGDANFATFVAIKDEEVCGMIGLLTQRSYEHDDVGGRILALVVSEKMRGQGVGRLLIEEAEQFFLGREIRRVAVNTRLEREGAHRFYEAVGFKRNGFRFVKDLSLSPRPAPGNRER